MASFSSENIACAERTDGESELGVGEGCVEDMEQGPERVGLSV